MIGYLHLHEFNVFKVQKFLSPIKPCIVFHANTNVLLLSQFHINDAGKAYIQRWASGQRERSCARMINPIHCMSARTFA